MARDFNYQTSKFEIILKCIWNGDKAPYSLPESSFCTERGRLYDCGRRCTYDMIKELNPDLPALTVVPIFQDVPVPIGILSVCEAMIAKANGENIPDEKLYITY